MFVALFKKHVTLRTVIVFVMAIAVFFMTLLALLTVRTSRELAAIQKKFESQQTGLERRVSTFEESDIATQDALKRIRDLAQNQPSTSSANVNIASPFPMQTVTGAVVELVCIDNTNKNTVYTASGVMVDPKGVIVTNQHILLSDDESLIRFCGVGFTDRLDLPPKVSYIATAVAVHPKNDLAILRISEAVKKTPLPSAFTAIAYRGATSYVQKLALGDVVYIAGYPGIGADTFTFTQGVVSGRVGKNYIKTSALIDTGTSGGAAFDAAGRFIGIATAAAKGEIGGSLGYLIGGDTVESFVSDYFQGKNLLPPAKK